MIRPSHLFHALPKPLIFAHRGASAYAPENTLAAFELSVRQGADGVELDARLSADGHVVVIHNHTVDHTTDGRGEVANLSLQALRELDAGSDFDAAFAGQRIPTLAEVLETVGRQRLVNIEIKPLATRQEILAEKIARIVARHQIEDSVLFSSFSPNALRTIRRHSTGAPIGLLMLKGSLSNWIARFIARLISFDTYHPEFSDVSPKLLAHHHRRNRPVLAYTVNDPAALARLFTWGIDGVFTDDPVLGQEIRAQSAFQGDGGQPVGE